MRIVWSGILVVLMLACGVMSSRLVRAQAAPTDYLPSSLFLPHADCFRIEGDGVLDFAGLVARFPGVPDAATVLNDLGWQAGAYRQYACDTPPPGQSGWIDISVHQFATEAGAQAAGPFFAEAKLLGTSLQMVPGVTAVTGPAGNGTEYTQYVTYSNILFRVTGVAPSGSPQHDVEQVANMQITLAAVITGREQRADAPPAQQAITYPYAITDLHTGYGNWSSAGLINNQSQVVVFSGLARDPLEISPITYEQHLTLLSRDMTVDLSPLGIDYGIALSDTGVLLGTSGGEHVLYVSATGQVQALQHARNSFLSDINSVGAMVGTVGGQSVILSAGQTIPLVIPPGFDGIAGSDINDRGIVAGTAYFDGRLGEQRAVLIENGVATVLEPAPGAEGSVATDLSNSGFLVGSPELKGARGWTMNGRGFFYDSTTGQALDIGILPGYQNSVPVSVNELGQAVGYAWSPLDSTQPFRRAFIFDNRTGVMTDLNSLVDPVSGWHLLSAGGINDAGQIVGAGHINGETHAFLLTPNP